MHNLISNLISWLDEEWTSIVAITLFIGLLGASFTWLGVRISRQAFQYQISMTEPWIMTKVGVTLWKLERNIPVLATICHIKMIHSDEKTTVISVGQDEADKSIYWVFKKGRNVVLDTQVYLPGSRFIICYAEHINKAKALEHYCDIEKRSSNGFTKKHEEWDTSLY